MDDLAGLSTFFVPPCRIELQPKEPESFILSIKLWRLSIYSFWFIIIVIVESIVIIKNSRDAKFCVSTCLFRIQLFRRFVVLQVVLLDVRRCVVDEDDVRHVQDVLGVDGVQDEDDVLALHNLQVFLSILLLKV